LRRWARVLTAWAMARSDLLLISARKGVLINSVTQVEHFLALVGI
jgi:hypothetical protein